MHVCVSDACCVRVSHSQTLAKDMMVPIELFNENWVLFRDENGQPACIKDTCAHRACPLSLGKVDNGQVVCAYHGWQFNGDGHCTKMPSTAFCRNVAVAALPCAEKDGFIWIWPGRGTPPDEVRHTHTHTCVTTSPHTQDEWESSQHGTARACVACGSLLACAVRFA